MAAFDVFNTPSSRVATLRTRLARTGDLLKRAPPPWDNGAPIRAELFSVERLEAHARSLAAAQPVTTKPAKVRNLSSRLADNAAMLLEAYRDVGRAIDEGAAITPAAEWLVDNYHLVERQIREVRLDLPPSYYRQLPKLAAGPFAGYPRVLGVAWGYVAHTDSNFDPEVLRRYLRAYQHVQPLTIGELWAVAITLRIVLVENLRRLAERVVESRKGRREADILADRLLGANGRAAEPLQATLGAFRQRPLPDAFFVQLAQRLRDQDPSIAPALTWLDERLTEQGTTVDEVVREEHQRQVTGSVTVRNIITSMRLISDVDWTELFEKVSLIDDVLMAASGFADMDFPTRNLYRSAIEQLARGSPFTELEVAHHAVLAADQARTRSADQTDARHTDPGYYLVAGGRPGFEAAIEYHAPPHARRARLYKDLGIGGYVLASALAAALLLAAPVTLLALSGLDWRWLWLLGALGVLPALDAAVAIVNFTVTRGVHASLLPALELPNGVPAQMRTLVAVPTLLTSRASIEELIERLEIHYLSGPDGDLHFALLSDWQDAASESVEGDKDLLDAAIEGVARLNRRYGRAPGGDRFLLLHRRRVWTASEGRWMGWERKRGKLNELNRLLRGASDTTFIPLDGRAPAMPEGVRYVITLDADTRLCRETVTRLIGKMAHPLNRPRLDARLGRVVEGYAVLQPRVTPLLPVGRQGSLFLRVFSSMNGIDPYAAAASDVYQDLFGEGSYTGKGIYDVDAFESALAGRVPQSALLSHDLFEGVFARSGLASDVEVMEDFPANYDAAALRHHRWARGDWQLLPWILGLARGTGRTPAARSVPAIGRWKMLDNLRRTASPPGIVLSLAAGWASPLPTAGIWTAFVLVALAIPPLTPLVAAIAPRNPGVSWRSHYRALARDVRLAFAQWALMIVLVAHQAWLMGDAIVRTLIRLCITHRNMLEWVPAAQASSGPQPGLLQYYRRMTGAVVLGGVVLAPALVWDRGTWPMAAAFAALWGASPLLALWASRSPPAASRRSLPELEATNLRLVARRTWRFFETFVTAADNMLPPDNFQETPDPIVAHRTSPTNIGLYLLSVASARDFGWIGTADAVDRIEATMATLDRLERCHGHFYNWYDTQDLRPLDPQYVSSVDSGNLAGHLIALANACREWRERQSPAAGVEDLSGVADALELAMEEAERLRTARRTQPVLWRQLDQELATLARGLSVAAPRDSEPLARLAGFVAQSKSMADTIHALAAEDGDDAVADLAFWIQATSLALETRIRGLDPATIGRLPARLEALEESARAMALSMDFALLLDPDRQLLSIGYKPSENALDPSCYDLLASEARLASFMAIAKGDVPNKHWFRLSHAVTPVENGAALISWSGSMFEYLMPSLVMRAPADSLLESTNQLIVRRQISYGRTLGTPWGISESAYNARDLELTYQYSNFGVPGLGLKRGLADNAVIAPYATALATMVEPRAAAENLKRLAGVGAQGRFGFYEALDFTATRVPDGQQNVIVSAFMAHHQGMTIVAIANTLLDGVMRARFHAEPMVRATELLLQERIPRDVAETPPWAAEARTTIKVGQIDLPVAWQRVSPTSATPATHLLSNGRYAVMLTAAGSGYSAWRDLAITRWREDVTCDDWGSYVYLRDVGTDEVWSAGLQPVGAEADAYDVVFNEDRAELTRRDGTLTTTLEALVSTEDDAEVRRITITNSGGQVREIEVTSYAELVLAPHAADVAHPAFSKLFIETEHLAGMGAILATRRRRAPTEPEVWAAHLAVVDGEVVGKREFETDRARFLGRGRGVRAPVAVMNGRPLSCATGPVLDAIFALRRRVRIAPGAVARIDFWTMAASSRPDVINLIDKHHDGAAFERAASMAWTQAQVQLHHLGIDRSEAGQFQRLAGHLIYAAPSLRPASDAIQSGSGGQPALWSLGISGDLPIILVRISQVQELEIARQALQAVEYWRMKRLAIDLVIVNEHPASYVQDLQSALETLVRANQSRPQIGDERLQGHIYLLRADLMPAETLALLAAVARAVLVGERGRLADHLERAPEAKPFRRPIRRQGPAVSELQLAPPAPDLEFFNGLGGFTKDGAEYVTILGPGQSTPAPWINVIANPVFGFQVAAEGGGYVWSVNSRERQITPWSNDPVSDRPGQAFYLRDEDTGEFWSPTASPIRDEESTYIARHGWGYSRFSHQSRGLILDLLEHVPLTDPVKISRLKIHNASGRARRLSATAYVEWVLGPSRASSAPFVSTAIDPESGAMLASNRWNPAFGDRVAFVDFGGQQKSWTGDRREFLGRNGSLASPAALLDGAALSGRVGSGLDPCGVLQTTFDLPAHGSIELVFVLGDAADAEAARGLIAKYRSVDLDAVLSDVGKHWDRVLGAVQVKTPDRSMDILLNGWLLYQTLACRVWARSGFYQASGAYGFRDQLQDGMALAASQPELTREHLVRAAGRQFVEGDVQHWWLPHSGQGVRTRISDDRAWLAYAVDHYVRVTGDVGVLDEAIPFLDGPTLKPDEHDNFFQPGVASETAGLYEHCARALDASLGVGGHGLPLMGGGDWNDGMNRVGESGRGESVWLGWLLCVTLLRFARIAEVRGDLAHSEAWRKHAEALRSSIEAEAWDGDWYRRAWFDDGAPLGSAANEECRIDSIAQSWAALSGVANPDRALRAMAAVERELIAPQDGLALLFTPPFDRTSHDPGYIKGYPPGIRENGGQYTHAALWSVMAFAALGEGDKAAALFSLLNPINHARTRSDVHRYKVEPYVVAADVYAVGAHVGRGGWTWYTGSSGWMQRAGVESILGLRIEDGFLSLDPCIPAGWRRFELSVRHGSAVYEIVVENPDSVARGVVAAKCDGEAIQAPPMRLALKDDGGVHKVHVRLGAAVQSR